MMEELSKDMEETAQASSANHSYNTNPQVTNLTSTCGKIDIFIQMK